MSPTQRCHRSPSVQLQSWGRSSAAATKSHTAQFVVETKRSPWEHEDHRRELCHPSPHKQEGKLGVPRRRPGGLSLSASVGSDSNSYPEEDHPHRRRPPPLHTLEISRSWWRLRLPGELLKRRDVQLAVTEPEEQCCESAKYYSAIPAKDPQRP
eukprot:CAMPEP_0197714818 /NCGR_PEP_ID=MMETSP1338-20131121/131149_1 /TAXON_ID=43686 ORGANISM="Pelagodinium beii, Strain RCC1491" /NCGR_SAMPLE_ID=MMETSP1338 /ASSEMBLY_ACC=CAM_ASM_000754 /LENGTH=153 /DNA_ID=CAMNT_0043298761 /DNA_START=1257 /DNA_END=1715 /DNA_ORIENTATION=+